MANVLLGVTGSVAATKTPELFDLLVKSGHEVKIVATQASLYFFDPRVISQKEGPATARDPKLVILDEDEWPGRGQGALYQRGDQVLHIELRRWADIFVVAPLDANTLAKLANGLSDNCLTCVWRAWDHNRPAVFAPAMNTLMWDNPTTVRHLFGLTANADPDGIPDDFSVDALPEFINQHCKRLRIVPPQSKRLACDDVGMGAMADLEAIVAMVNQMVSQTTPASPRPGAV